MILQSSFTSWMNHFIDYMGGCFGCCSKSRPITAVDEPSKGLRIQGQTVKKSTLSDDFWSTSTCDIDFSAVQSQRSLSSISISNVSLSQSSGTTSAGIQSEFVNHGLLRWNQSRIQWVESRKTNKGKAREPVLSWNATYESLLGTSKRFPQPIPLSEMIEFLADIWEHEGLYD
ncbi:uncharacterized protein LOC112516675 [Cynara cardunculus var. scolymus]|uniref:uncharacterized protein LOC112516675 n=1 Tax=Cynara cardunculus var. scolymus TaxID=59895 RepID=UPI000D62FA15|nr:uncharacterized protein LOC112516675 [Cynara cardunculus var. scolymus]